ncbi:MAG: hypothetical protein OEV81_16710 [Betaproteobacteria bacterium]|nr:hypothetical protein [Betaproteobacteria bacterium]MDH5220796.1 hypothetical protein [Betaproteobacteria bacterium]MDH5350372.1 hypothetical protein [Betaproteobacteria bacterium]
MTITELETFYLRLDAMRMTPADRELAKARLDQAEAFAAALHAALSWLRRPGEGQHVFGHDPL